MIQKMNLLASVFFSYAYVTVTGYIVTNFGSGDVLKTTFYNSKLKYAEHEPTENPLSSLDREIRATLCTDMFQTSFFQKENVQEANKRDIFVRFLLRQSHPTSYELHYFEEHSNSEPELIYPTVMMNISSSFFLEELVLPCLAADSSGMLFEFFISYGYKKDMFFVHQRDVTRNLVPVAVMERGALQVIDFVDNDFGIEEKYAEQRMLSGNKNINQENPLFRLDESKKDRFIALILDASYFRFLGLKLDTSTNGIDYNLRKEKVFFRSGKYMDLQWDEDVLRFKVHDNTNDKSENFYVGWGYNAKESSVFLFRDQNNEIHVEIYVKNVPVFDRSKP